MLDFTLDYVAILVRWLHLIAGIAWIGASFYFVWLDNHIEAPDPPDERVAGELWAVHGGGFYNSRKYVVSPPRLPERLHWFKWEAYWTWISGFTLFVLIYFAHPREYLISPDRPGLAAGWAIAISVALMLAAWVVYDLVCRSPLARDGRVLGTLVVVVVGLLGWGLSEIYSGRGVFIQIGAMIGTIMVANVAEVIIPGQRRMVAAMTAGTAPDPEDGRRGKQRSVHNNYLTLPVLLLMLSNHWASAYSDARPWLVLALVTAAGMLIRHFVNLRHKGRIVVALPIAALVLLGALGVYLAPRDDPAPGRGGRIRRDRADHRPAVCRMPRGRADPAGVLGGTRRGAPRHAGRDRHQRPAGLRSGRARHGHATRQPDRDDRRRAGARWALGPERRRGPLMEPTLIPTSLPEALELRAAHPGAVLIAGGTDLMVEMNFDQIRPERMIDLTRVAELTTWERRGARIRLGAGVDYTRIVRELHAELPALAIASRTVGSLQIRNRGTVGGNLGTASPAGDALPPLVATDASVELASVRGTRSMRVVDFLTGVKRNALAPDELIVAIDLPVARGPQQFSKVGTRNAMVIAVCSFALAIDAEARTIGTGIGSAAPGIPSADAAEQHLRGVLDERGLWERPGPLTDAETTRFGELVAAAAKPIDDVRGTAAYRLHALAVLARRTLDVGVGPTPRGSPRMRITMSVNGERLEVDGALGGREPPLRPSRATRPAGVQERVRAGRVRLVQRLPRW